MEREPRAPSVGRSRLALDTTLAALYVAALVLFASVWMYQTLFRTWFFSSDEYVFAAEVIRFSALDFRQQFFDIPGTPFMLLSTAAWSLGYLVARAFGAAGSDSLATFTFEHMAGLFVLMRGLTVVFFLLSIVLLFVLLSRLLNKAAAAAACLLLAMSPVYTSYSSFVRTESLAMVFMLLAMLLIGRGIERETLERSAIPRVTDSFVLAGCCAGLAASARLHSLVAILPALVLSCWLQGRETASTYPRWVLRSAGWLLPITWAAGIALVVAIRRQYPQMPAAATLFTIAVSGWIAATGPAVLFYRFRATRPTVVRTLGPDVIKVVAGTAAGFLLGNLTVIPQHRFFLQSIQMYTAYVDLERLNWPLWKNLTWYVQHYVAIVAPDSLAFWLLGVGALLILIDRNRQALPMLAAAALFFVSKPLKLQAQPHHAILWLPFFFAVCAYPVGRVFILAARRFGGAIATIGVTLLLAILFGTLSPGPKWAALNAMAHEPRLQNIGAASEWIKTHAGARDTVAITYFCFNPDAFYTWLRALSVPVPASVFDGREYIIWWGHGSTLAGKTGYACATPSDVGYMKVNLDTVAPGEGTDPYTDPRFTPAASFGTEGSRVDVFRFDYR